MTSVHVDLISLWRIHFKTASNDYRHQPLNMMPKALRKRVIASSFRATNKMLQMVCRYTFASIVTLQLEC